MSFSFDFKCVNAATAREVLKTQYCPGPVLAFIEKALEGIAGPVHVRAQGHLYSGDYNMSNCALHVEPIMFTDVATKEAATNARSTVYVSPRAG